jgi:thioredoxin-dependent peroxiredoxin
MDCAVFGISFDTPADNQAFRTKFEFPFALLSDPDRAVGALYQTTRAPDDSYANFPQRISYLIDPAGVIVTSYAVTDPAGHAEEVLADLEAAQR